MGQQFVAAEQHRHVPFEDIEPKVMPFILPSVTFHQNMLDRLPAEPTRTPTGFPRIDLSKVGGQADFTSSELYHDRSRCFALARPIFKAPAS